MGKKKEGTNDGGKNRKKRKKKKRKGKKKEKGCRGQFSFDVVHITTKNADVPLMWSLNTTLTNFLGRTCILY